MNFEKKNNIYKSIMLIAVTAIITFLITSIGIYNYIKSEEGPVKTFITTKTSELETKIKLVREYLNKTYLNDITNEEELIESAIKGYVEGIGDEYTEYLSKEEYEELMINVNGDYVGIGIYMTQDRYGNIVVLLPIEGSPAEEEGLKTGDIITKINGEDCSGMELDIVANKVMSVDEGRIVYEKLKSVVERFLNGKVNYLGMVPADTALEKAVRAQKTVSLFEPKSNSAKAYEVLAKNLMQGTHEQVQMRRGIGQMFSNLLNRRK